MTQVMQGSLSTLEGSLIASLKLVKSKKEVIIFVSGANSKFLRACIPRPVGWISMQ